MNDKIRTALGIEDKAISSEELKNALTNEESVKCNYCNDTGFDSMSDGQMGECLMCTQNP